MCSFYCKFINIWKYTLHKSQRMFHPIFSVLKRMNIIIEETSELQRNSRKGYAEKLTQRLRHHARKVH